MYRQQNHQRRAKTWADSNHRSPVYKTGAITTMLQSHVTDVSRSTFTDTVMVKKPKGPMRIKTMQNVSTAKSSKTSEDLGGLEPPISYLRDRRINHYATEPCYTERYQEVHSLI